MAVSGVVPVHCLPEPDLDSAGFVFDAIGACPIDRVRGLAIAGVSRTIPVSAGPWAEEGSQLGQQRDVIHIVREPHQRAVEDDVDE